LFLKIKCFFVFFVLQPCPDVEIIDERSLSDTIIRMTKRSDEIYNSNLLKSGNNANTSASGGSSADHLNHQLSMPSQPYRISDSTTGGKLPIHGPRRFAKPASIFNADFVTSSNKFVVTKSEVENYNIICKLASSQFQRLVVNFFFLLFSFSFAATSEFNMIFNFLVRMLLICLE